MAVGPNKQSVVWWAPSFLGELNNQLRTEAPRGCSHTSQRTALGHLDQPGPFETPGGPSQVPLWNRPGP